MEIQHTKTWDVAKAVLRRKFKMINAYIKKKERSQVHDLTLHLQELEKEETKPTVSRRTEIMIRKEIK